MVVIDTEKEGLEKIYKEKYVPLIKKLLTEDLEMISREAWELLLEELAPQTISRASVINFLNDNVDEDNPEKGVLKFREKTGKGGYHRVYSRNMTLDEFWQHIANQVNQALEPHI